MSHRATHLRRLGVGLTVSFALCAVALQAAASEHAGHGELGINWWTWDQHVPPLGWFLVDFGLFIGGLVFFAARPLADLFAARHLRIKRSVAEAATQHARAQSQQHEWREKMAKVEAEVRTLLETTAQEAAAERDQIIKEGRVYAETMSRDSQSLAEAELQRARQRLQQTVLRQALGRTVAILHEQLTDDDRQRLIEAAIDSVEHDAPVQPAPRPTLGGGQ